MRELWSSTGPNDTFGHAVIAGQLKNYTTAK
jgi:hypothetical protein